MMLKPIQYPSVFLCWSRRIKSAIACSFSQKSPNETVLHFPVAQNLSYRPQSYVLLSLTSQAEFVKGYLQYFLKTPFVGLKN
jgi:hypothetical protein